MLLMVFALVVATVVIIGGLSIFKPKPPVRSGDFTARLPVEVIKPTLTDFNIVLPSQGLVSAVTEATLAAQVAGNVIRKSLNFSQGGSFKKGEVLVYIDDADYISALRIAESNFNQSNVALQEELARADQALRDWTRLGNGSQASDLVLRKPQLEAAQAALDASTAQVQKAKLDLQRTKVLAPYDGRVIGGAIDEGSYVNPGRALGEIVESNRLKVDLPVSASWRHLLDWSGNNASVTLTLDVGDQPAQWHGTIRSTSADISEGSRQFTVIADVELDTASRTDVALFIGDYVRAEIDGKSLSDVLVLPRTAIYNDSYVWYVEEERIYKRDVDIVWQDRESVVISRGVNEQDLIVITPLGNVVSGTAVNIIEKKQPVIDTDEDPQTLHGSNTVDVMAEQG